MTPERHIFVLWLAASEEMERSSDSQYVYYWGKAVALIDAFAAITGTTFVEASRTLLNMRERAE